jgi:hypothetical protein
MAPVAGDEHDEEAVLLNEETNSQQQQEHPKRSMVPGLILSALALFSTALFANKSFVQNSIGDSSELDSSLAVTHKLVVTRIGYNAIADHTISVYSLDHVVEPDTTMILKITTCDNCGDITWSIKPVGERGSVSYDSSNTKSTIKAVFKDANSDFSIKAHLDGHLILDEIATCKYVRREMTAVRSQDMNRFFVAMKILYTRTQEEGVKEFGKNYLSYQHLTGLHNTHDFQYHGNMFFLTSHPAMQVKFEKSLLSIDPGVVLPYWDFLKDAKLGKDWSTSKIYSNDFFGAVNTYAEDGYRVPGRFHDVMMISDVDKLKFPNAFHSPFGYLGSSEMTTSSKYLTRANTYCGFKSVQGQVQCTNLVTCFDGFESNHNLREMDTCLEDTVHANIHMMHAGQWNCAVDWAAFYTENEDWVDETFLSIVAVMMSTISMAFDADGNINCPTTCDATEGTSCLCTSSMSGVATADDVDTLTRAERLTHLVKPWKTIATLTVGGSQYVKMFDKYDMAGTTYDNVFLPVNIKGDDYEEGPMDNEKIDKLNTLLLKTILFPGDYGVMMTGAAPNDPMFWVMHPLFDKVLHSLRLSSRYNSEGFEWNNIKGDEKWEGMTPFKRLDFEPYLGAGTKTKGEYLKNSELWNVLHPSSEAVYYIYDQFTEWGDCDFDPFEESDE